MSTCRHKSIFATALTSLATFAVLVMTARGAITEDFEGVTPPAVPSVGWGTIGTGLTTSANGNPGNALDVAAGSARYLYNTTALDGSKNFSGSFDFYLNGNENYDNISFWVGDLDGGLTTTAGDHFRVDLKKISFSRRASIYDATGNDDADKLFDGDNNNSFRVDPFKWYTADFSWTAGTGAFSINWDNGAAVPMTFSGYTLNNNAVNFGFGTIDAAGYFDNITLNGSYFGQLDWTGSVSSEWNTSEANWDAGGATTWNNDGTAVAYFGGASGSTVTLAQDAAIAANIIVLDTAGYTIAPAAVPGTETLEVGTVEANQDGTISANIIGSDLAKTGTGTLTLSGTNTYTGDTIISAGTLLITDIATNLGGGDIVNSGTLDLNLSAGTSTSKNITGGGTLDVAAGGTGTVTLTGTSYDIGSLIVGSGDLVQFNSANAGSVGTLSGDMQQSGSGTLSLTGDNSGSSGTVTVDAGTTLGIGGNLGSGVTLTTAATSAIDLSTTSTATVATAIGAGSVTQSGSGTTTLSGTNTYAGDTTLAAGTLQADSASALGSGNITFTGGALQYTANSSGQDWATRFVSSTGTVSLDTNGQDVTLAGIIDSSNTGGLTKSGAGTLTLTGTNAYTGATTISGGTLKVDADGLAAAAVTNNGTLELAPGAATTYSNAISGSGNLVTNPTAGDVTLDGNISIGGTTTVSSGKLVFDGSTSTLSGAVSGGNIDLNNSSDLTLAGDSSGYGGTVTLTDSGSTLNVQGNMGGSIAGPGTGTGTVNFNSASTIAVSGGIGGSLNVNQSGAGVTTLTGNNSYNGSTSVSAGELVVSGTGDINDSTSIGVTDTGKLTYDSSTALTKKVTVTGATSSMAIGAGRTVADVDLASGATLDVGDLSTAGAVAVDSGTIELGDGTTAKLTATSVTVGSNGATLNWDFNSPSDFDQIVGNLDIDGGVLTIHIDYLGSDDLARMNFTVFDGSVTGSLENVLITGFSSESWSVSSGSLILTYIPEPSTIILGGLGLMGITFRRRRRN